MIIKLEYKFRHWKNKLLKISTKKRLKDINCKNKREIKKNKFKKKNKSKKKKREKNKF
jgi:hypothetical protein